MKKKKHIDGVIEICLWAGTLIVIIPMLFVFINGLKTGAETAGNLTIQMPEKFMWQNYVEIVNDGGVAQSFLNSIVYSFVSVILTCIFSAMTAFVIVRKNTIFNSVIFKAFLVGMIAPINMVTMSKLMNALHLVNTYYGIILLYIGTFIPISVFLYMGFVKGLPMELDESAMIDGASAGTIFWRIIFPLLKPVTVTVFILNFVSCWNDFLYPLYFTSDSNKWGVILLLYQYMGQFSSDKHLLFAAAGVVMIPTIIVYIFGQNYIIDGMTAGAVKG